MNIPTRIALLVLGFALAAMAFVAPASADPYSGREIDPHLLDTDNAYQVTVLYTHDVINRMFRDAGLGSVDFVIVGDATDIAAAEAKNPNSMIVNAAFVDGQRWAGRVAAAYELGTEVSTHQMVVNGKPAPYVTPLQLMEQQSYLGGAVVGEMGKLTGLSVEPGSKDQLAIVAMMTLNAKAFPPKQQQTVLNDLWRHFEEGLEKGVSNAY